MHKINNYGIVYYRCTRCNEVFNDNDVDFCPICGHEFNKPFEHNSYTKHIVKEHWELTRTIRYWFSKKDYELAVITLENHKNGIEKFIVELDSRISRRAITIIRSRLKRYIEDGVEDDFIKPQDFITARIKLEGNIEDVQIEKNLTQLFIDEIKKNSDTNSLVMFSMKCMHCMEVYENCFHIKENVNDNNITSQIFKHINLELNKCEKCSSVNMWNVINIMLDNVVIYPQESGIEVQKEFDGSKYVIIYYELAQLINTTFNKFNLDFSDLTSNDDYKHPSLIITIYEFLNIFNSLWYQPLMPFEKTSFGGFDKRITFFNQFIDFLNEYFEIDLGHNKITHEKIRDFHKFIGGKSSKMSICLKIIKWELEKDINANKINYMEGDPNLFIFLETIYPGLKRFYNDIDISIPFFNNYTQTRQFLLFFIHKKFGEYFGMVDTGFSYEYFGQYKEIVNKYKKSN